MWSVSISSKYMKLPKVHIYSCMNFYNKIRQKISSHCMIPLLMNNDANRQYFISLCITVSKKIGDWSLILKFYWNTTDYIESHEIVLLSIRRQQLIDLCKVEPMVNKQHWWIFPLTTTSLNLDTVIHFLGIPFLRYCVLQMYKYRHTN